MAVEHARDGANQRKGLAAGGPKQPLSVEDLKDLPEQFTSIMVSQPGRLDG